LIPLSDGSLYLRSRPVVNTALLAANALVFLYSLVLGGFSFLVGGGSPAIAEFFYTWGFIPAEFPSRKPFTTLGLDFLGSVDITTPVPTWGTIFSSMFMHSGLLHFAGNMAYLWVFGRALEDRLGHVKYLAFYLTTGVLATLSHWFFFQESQTPLIGASGAISGVLGAYLFLFPYNRVRVLVMLFIITVIRLPASYVLGFYLLLQLVQLLFSIGVSDEVSVALWAHIGGFAAGAGIVVLYRLGTGQRPWPSRYTPSSQPRQYWRGRPLD
jgi:membrane associated rhomboid family serine protease